MSHRNGLMSHGYTKATITEPRVKSVTNFLYLNTSSVNEALRDTEDL